jgi:hypothetical protein
MKLSFVLIPLVAVACASAAQAQTRIWRCGNTYTNDEAQARAQGCKLVEGGNVTVVTGTRVNNANAAPQENVRAKPRSENVATAPLAAGSGGQRVEEREQKARDNDARAILEAELKKAEARQAELAKEYNNGEPERRGDERNYQKYLDRVADMKAAIARKENDIAAIKRELAKLPQ